ncbi:MAG: universal stress protein [Acidobacteria bacterium]|nr:MAG: universal stress protein [Acidobacteriota bacterium]
MESTSDSHTEGDASRVLLATDFSRAAEAAAEWTLALCRHSSAELTVGHCVDGLVDSVFYFDDPRAKAHANATRSAKEHLATYAGRFGDLPRVSTKLVDGVPWRGIVELAEELESDLVVVGTRGLRGLDKLLLGSTARAVIQHCASPVLTVPSGAAPRDEAISPSGGDLHVVFATDFSQAAAAALDGALHLLPAPSRLTLLNVYASPYLEVPYAAMPTQTDLLAQARRGSERELQRLAEQLGGRLAEDTEIAVAALEGYPPTAIVDFATTARQRGLPPVDLLVLGTHGRSGLGHLVLGSVAERTVQSSPVPVLTVRSSG